MDVIRQVIGATPRALTPLLLVIMLVFPNHSPQSAPRRGFPAARTASGVGRGLRFEALERRAMLAGDGLLGQYFHNADFTGLAAERSEAVDFAWGTAAPAAGVNADSFSVRWLGQLEAAYSETYMIRTISDEGVRLWIGGQLVIDNWAPHSAVVNSATVALQAGQRYDVRLEYFDNSGTAQMRLQWSSASQPLESIPASRLYASPAGLLGEYRDAAAGAAQRVDATINFDWAAGPPAPGLASDGFHVAWTGYVRTDFSELYTFALDTSDAVRLWVGDQLVIDNFAEHPPATSSGTKLLEAGKWHDIRLEYRDVSGDAAVRLAWSSDRQTGGSVETIPAPNLRAGHEAPLYFTNPLGQGQDPWVIQWQDSYLHVRSSGNSVWIDQADQLQDIHSSDPASSSTRVWTAPGGTNYSQQLWAPELHRLDGKWYIYVAASDGNNATHRMHVLERDADSPLGSFTYKGQLAAATDRWAIDGTVLQWQGQRYFVWSGWPGFADGQQNLYIAEMSDPWTLAGNRSLLATPSFAWEQHGLPINEGPQVLVHDGQLHIIYSGSGYWSPNYALGRLTYDGSGSLLSAANWVKSSTPVFQKTAEVVGVGHASFTKSPDGTEDWIVFHAHPSPGGDPDQRVVRIQKFTYNADSTPNFGTPLPPSASIEYPSGYPDPDRLLIAGDFDASGVVNGTDLQVFAAQFGEATFPGAASDGFDFLAWQQAFGATAATQALVVAEEPATALLTMQGPPTLAPSANPELFARTVEIDRARIRRLAFDAICAMAAARTLPAGREVGASAAQKYDPQGVQFLDSLFDRQTEWIDLLDLKQGTSKNRVFLDGLE